MKKAESKVEKTYEAVSQSIDSWTLMASTLPSGQLPGLINKCVRVPCAVSILLRVDASSVLRARIQLAGS